MPDRPAKPGPWLLLTGVAALGSVLAVVVTGDWGKLPHYGAALVALSLLIALVLAVWFGHRERRRLVILSIASLGLYLVQLASGGLVGLADNAGWPIALHLALSGVALLALLLTVADLLTGERRSRSLPTKQGGWRDYITLTKPRIMTLLLLTAAGGMFVGARGVPPLGLLLAMLGGLALASGGASALNHLLDRDIDQHMSRTDRRPVAMGRISPERALEFGLALSAFSFVVLASFTNILTAALAIFGNLFYVLVYTRWLKRTTPHNIVIGGAAGAIPPVVGYAAATGNLALPALFLFLIVFVWTPPHFWALALLIKRDYAAARVPMLPVVSGDSRTAKAIVRYTALTVLVTMLPVITGDLRWLYLAAALALGAAFLGLALALERKLTPERSRRLFTFSLAYLALLFVAMAIDPIVL